MCGIAGIVHLYSEGEISPELLKRMITMVRHRGPDGYGFFRDERAGLAHARLSIIDIEGGRQPIYNENKSVVIVFNGEIFNYRELREALEKKGHRFYTMSDTEVIIHLYEDHGVDCLKHLNGQFAFAIWDKPNRKLFIARDRVGIRPLFYLIVDGQLLFASEIKALFADPRVKREIDPYALDQIFTFWMTASPRTTFRGVKELPAGHYLLLEKGTVKQEQYWDPDFSPATGLRSETEYAEALKELMIDATRLQLRADVPVGAYLSGGIDSSVITSLIKNFTDTPLRTFSVTFTDATYDESAYQRQMIDYLHANHTDIQCTHADIGGIFPDVIWHTEKPLVRTAAAPFFLLSKLVRDSGYKVVLTGEGADEILSGYDIFKEVKIRQFLQRYPDSKFRPHILKRLYPYLANSPVKSLHYAEAFFMAASADYPAACRSHIPRWNTTAKTKVFFSDRLKQELFGYRNREELASLLKEDFGAYDPLSKAQYLEIKTLLPGYILSSQGDRVAMAHSIEGRFPFLDHRVIDFCCKLPPAIRMKALTEKYILRKSMKNLVPEPILKRTKQPYMAPDAKSFFSGGRLDYVEELFSERNIRETGYFNPKTVAMLLKKCKSSPILGFKDNMAVVGILSTLLVHDLFIDRFDEQSRPLAEGGKREEDGQHAVTV
jgi:asparagine synthase (glutamine-hydrolysing)